MKTTFTNLKIAAIIGFVLVLPFMILELANRRNSVDGFPVALFVFMWLLAVAFIAILTPIIHSVRAGNSLMANPVNLLFSVVILAVVAMMWGYNLYDQLPCFLGVPNCD